jgi:hypothetical protein
VVDAIALINHGESAAATNVRRAIEAGFDAATFGGVPLPREPIFGDASRQPIGYALTDSKPRPDGLHDVSVAIGSRTFLPNPTDAQIAAGAVGSARAGARGSTTATPRNR